MKFFKNILVIVSILIVSSLYIFFNLGNFLDATSNPKETDLIICLGGGNYENRGKKSLELYEKDFVKTNTIIFTGYTNIKDFKGANIVVNRNLQNTYEEVIFVKNYMKENGLKSATFVSEAPHSKRILLFTKLFGMGDFEFNVVGSDYEWDAKYYYKYPHMTAFVFTEITKIFYNLFLYGLLDTLGLKESFQNNFQEEILEGKREILETFI